MNIFLKTYLSQMLQNGLFNYKECLGGGVYVVKNPHPDVKNEWKIGKSNNIRNRLRNASVWFSNRIKSVFVIYPVEDIFYTSCYLFSIEKQIHAFLKEIRINDKREWFKIELDFPVLLKQIVNHLEDVYKTRFKIAENPVELKEVRSNRLDITRKYKSYSRTKIKPYPYQEKIISKITTVFNEHDRGKLILPPGIGKSYITGFYIKRTSKYKKILILTPQILICNDFKLALELTRNTSISIINSDERHSERKDVFNNDSRITITTYSMFCTKTKDNKKYFDKYNYDFIVYDEAHCLCSKEYSKSMNIQAKNVSIKKLFLTATEKIVNFEYKESNESKDEESENEYVIEDLSSEDEESENEYVIEDEECENEDILFDMNSEEFGVLIHKESLGKCIIDGKLADYKLFINDWNLGLNNTLKTIKNKFHHKKIIMFFNRCDNSKKTCEMIKKAGFENCFHLDSNTPREEKKRYINKFKQSEFSIICNVDIISIGVNIPCIDTIIFMETRKSSIQFIQNIGRGLRLHNKKDFCAVLMTRDMYFNHKIIKTLKNHDFRATHRLQRITETKELEIKMEGFMEFIEHPKDSWDYKYTLCKEYESENGKITQSTVYKDVNLGIWVSNQKTAFKKNKLDNERLEKMSLLCSWVFKETKKYTWDEMYALCKEYESENGKITQSTVYKDVNLGMWVNRQKRSFKKNKFDDKRLEKLSLLRSWVFKETKKNTWDEMYALCKEYESKNGKITKRTVYKDANLGTWISTQKRSFKKNKLSDKEMYIKRFKKLDNLSTWKN